jgi:hypothetical protein
MSITYDIRIWKTSVYEGQRRKTYKVRWVVAGKSHNRSFKTSALAESFRSALVSAARKGEAFDTESGNPVSMHRRSQDMSWYKLACMFVDMKWPRVAATTRRTHTEAMTAVTTAMFTSDRGKPDNKLVRAALCRWAFNANRHNDPGCPENI